jgi:malonate-semialdehyde dehydrogenase (acetylating)/methylmalonate-semialdehyde dehydrogenase
MPRLVEASEKMVVGPTDAGGAPDMGPLVSAEHLTKVRSYIDAGEKEGAKLSLDGRKLVVKDSPKGYFLGPTIFDHATAKMKIVREEIFGPVLSVVRVNDIDEAIRLGQDCEFGNGAVIFTNSGRAAREFKHRFNAGMIGINVGVPASMAWFPFTGWNTSFFGDLHIQGKEGILFYTQQKMTMTRWFTPSKDQFHDPVWKSRK